MLLKDKEKHHKEMLIELEEVILDKEYREENESPYLIDYLYGNSDINLIVDNYLVENTLEDEWVIFYRCIVKKEVLEAREYDLLRSVGEELFLIRNERDLERFLNFIEDNKIKSLNKNIGNVDSVLNDLLEYLKINKKIDSTQDNLFNCKEIKNEFLKFLKEHFKLKGKDNEAFENNLYEMDCLLGEAYKDEKIIFSKTDFFTHILKINRSKISSIQKKYGDRRN